MVIIVLAYGENRNLPHMPVFANTLPNDVCSLQQRLRWAESPAPPWDPRINECANTLVPAQIQPRCFKAALDIICSFRLKEGPKSGFNINEYQNCVKENFTSRHHEAQMLPLCWSWVFPTSSAIEDKEC